MTARRGWGRAGMVLALSVAGLMGSVPVNGQTPGDRTADEGTGSNTAMGNASVSGTAPAPWLQEDPGGRLYQEARDLLARGSYRAAADAFAALRDAHPTSGYVPDAYYWEAFARSRVGGQPEMRRAVELLGAQAEAHPRAATRTDADALRMRIEGELARRGDARAAAVIAQEAQTPCGPGQEARLAALSALMNMNAAQAVPILQDVLRQRDACSAELRARAVFLIAQRMDAESVDILLELAHRNPDPDPEVRGQAVFWLHQVRSDEALDALQTILSESGDPELQEQALFAISQRANDPRALEVLRGYATRTDIPTRLRANAIFWIGQSRDAGGARYLMDIYPRLDDQELRDNALFAIAQSETPESRAWLLQRVRDPSESLEVRKNALFWAGQGGAVPTQDLQALFESFTDPEMRGQIVFVAAQRGSAEDIDFLMHVARTATDPGIRESAIFWLGQSDDPRVPEFLLSLLRG